MMQMFLTFIKSCMPYAEIRLASCIRASHLTMNCRMVKLPTVLGPVHPPLAKIPGRLRLFAPPWRSCRQSQALSTSCAPHSSKLRDVSGSVYPHGEIVDSLRLWALCVHSAHQHCGTPRALCTPMVKTVNARRL